MSGQNDSNRHSKTGTDTLIGAGLRLDGNIACTGVLRIHGDIHGDVSCNPETSGTIVVGQSGNVAGTLRASHIVVGGQVRGPMESSGSIEIQAGASVAGDASYRAIRIHPGGVIDGSLTPRGLPDGDGSRPEDRPALSAPAAHQENGGRGRLLKAPWLIGTLMLLGATVAIALLNQQAAPAGSPPATAAQATAAPTEAGVPREAPANTVGTAILPAAGLDASAVKPEQAPPAQIAEAEKEEVVLVRGVNPGKPGGVFSVLGREPAVLFRKMRDDSSPGTRIDVPQGAAASISFAGDEIFRVAQGHDIEIFYQGRKVGPKTIESGAWMSFVPQSSAAAGEKR